MVVVGDVVFGAPVVVVVVVVVVVAAGAFAAVVVVAADVAVVVVSAAVVSEEVGEGEAVVRVVSAGEAEVVVFVVCATAPCGGTTTEVMMIRHRPYGSGRETLAFLRLTLKVPGTGTSFCCMEPLSH